MTHRAIMARGLALLALAGVLVAPERVGRAAPPDLTLYATHCARCHGDRGDGDSEPARIFAGPRPRNFVSGVFKLKSTPGSAPPTDEDLRRVIADGVPGTSMPYFRDLLEPDEIDALVGVVRSFHPAPVPPPVELGPAPAESPEGIARGRAIYTRLGCERCHGASGHGDGPAAPTLTNDDESKAVPTDLTRPWRYHGGAELKDIMMRLTVGMPGTPMPAFDETLSRAELWDLAAYVRSLGRGQTLRAAVLERASRPAGDGEDLTTRGAYVVRSSACHTCHTPVDSKTLRYVWDDYLGGGMEVSVGAYGTWYSRNLTPDPQTGLGTWDAGELRRVFRNGVNADGRRLSPLCMPWHLLGEVTDRDVDAIFAYLRSLPPVKNVVPPPEAAPFFPALVRKAAILAGLRPDEDLHFSNGGNRGRPPAPGERVAPAENPGRHRIAAALVALLGLVGLALARRREDGRRRRTVAVVAIVLVGAAGTFLYMFPPYAPWVPRELIMSLSQPLPPPVVATDPSLRTIAERGRYIAVTGMCAMCHSTMAVLERGHDHRKLALAGGAKNSLPTVGTVYTANLTSDVQTGLGGWSDDELRRALRSGISKGGHVMHHLLMPWVHTANLDVEDMEALIVYLRQVPPVSSKMPPRAPPAPGDPDHYLFHMGYFGTQSEQTGARP